MSTKAPFSILSILFLLFVLLASPLQARADSIEESQNQVNAVVDEVVSAFAGKSLSLPEKSDKLRELIGKYGDVRMSAEYMLGRYWSKATPEQQDAFVKLVVDYVIGSWSNQVTDLPATFHLEIVSTEALPDGRVVVHSTSFGQTSEPVDWALARSSDGRMVFIDVTMEGISVIQTLRSDFTGIIRANNGKFDALLDALRIKIASYQNKT